MAFPNKNRIKEVKMNDEGKYAYAGDYLRPCDADRKSGTRTKLAGMLFALIVIVVTSGTISAAGAADAAYVILPYAGETIALFVTAWYLIKIIFSMKKLRVTIFEGSDGKIRGGSVMLFVFALLGFALSIVYIVRNGMGENPFQSLLYLLLKLTTAGMALMLRKTYLGISWDRIESKERKAALNEAAAETNDAAIESDEAAAEDQ